MGSETGWKPLFKGEVEGRPVELQIYADGELRVITTQKVTEATDGSFEPGTDLFPHIISEGDEIHIDAETAEGLEAELVSAAGVSVEAAKNICARIGS